ncbi:hypothetical protein H6G80_25620 [Nostoc sp. FACHB-87]|uniref:hypothetical protein n=1 Tax=Nostocaceae TaxID=1162 RepID=UPI001686468D|nr:MULTISPECIES: hypothetical protein [Nostocaceae]MBD2457444.1 hypothetical protein [Nostoc sp. FACHB-87]MBD2476595.1 hypothetical protein [Anabaena sp. FACHB-83]
MTLNIFIDYKLINDLQWHIVEMSPEEYFDTSLLEEGEQLIWNSIPEYNHAIEYLNIDPSLVSDTRIRVQDSESLKTLTIITTFWNNGNNFIIERIDNALDKAKYVMIIQTKLQEDPTIWEIMRFKKKSDVLELEFHTFIRENEDGSQTEKKIFPKEI